MMRAIGEDVDEIVIPHLESLVVEAQMLRPDSLTVDADWSESVNRLIATLSVQVNRTMEGASALAIDIGQKVSRWNDKQWQKILKSVVGVEIFQSEPWLAGELNNFAKINADMITTLGSNAIKDVENITRRGIQGGTRHETIAKKIRANYRPIKDLPQKWINHSRLIARDQVSKLNGNLTMLRQENMGVKYYIWQTSGDRRVRDTHEANQGEKFSWYNAPMTGHPGQDIQCRCTAEAVFPNEIYDLTKQERVRPVEELIPRAVSRKVLKPKPAPTPKPAPVKTITPKPVTPTGTVPRTIEAFREIKYQEAFQEKFAKVMRSEWHKKIILEAGDPVSSVKRDIFTELLGVLHGDGRLQLSRNVRGYLEEALRKPDLLTVGTKFQRNEHLKALRTLTHEYIHGLKGSGLGRKTITRLESFFEEAATETLARRHTADMAEIIWGKKIGKKVAEKVANYKFYEYHDLVNSLKFIAQGLKMEPAELARIIKLQTPFDYSSRTTALRKIIKQKTRWGVDKIDEFMLKFEADPLEGGSIMYEMLGLQ